MCNVLCYIDALCTANCLVTSLLFEYNNNVIGMRFFMIVGNWKCEPPNNRFAVKMPMLKMHATYKYMNYLKDAKLERCGHSIFTVELIAST